MLSAKQKKLVRDNVHADKISFKKDGTVEFRYGYFYRHGMDEFKFTDAVVYKLQGLGFKVDVVSSYDRWAPWPRDSYFAAVLRIADDMVSV